MPAASDIELRELTIEEGAGYFRGVQGIWGGGLAEDKFVAFQRRLAASPEASGRYRMLGLFDRGDGALLSAMKTYQLEGGFTGAPLRILGIGAVFTPPALRRRGFAALMLRAAMARLAAEGADAAVLFSDIGDRYYAQLGFHVLQSRECFVAARDLPRPDRACRSAGPGDEAAMSRIFEASRDRSRLSLAREGWLLRFQLRRLRELARVRDVGEPEWGLIVDAGRGCAAAMTRLTREGVDVLEAAWDGASARDSLLGGLRDLLSRAGRTRLRLWPSGQLRGQFAEVERASAIAMIAPLRAGVSLPEPGAAADFSLLDHI